MMREPEWLTWSRELQALAQAGLTYTKDAYDRERFERIREIAAQMVAAGADLPLDTVQGLFCNEQGYPTPKLDTRAAIVEEGKILLVQEVGGLWALPGGWADVGLTIAENAVKETLEESGYTARPKRLIALLDHARNHPGPCAWSIQKAFVLCERTGGAFTPNLETIASSFFGPEELPPLAVGKTTEKEIRMCLEAAEAEHWETVFD